MADAKEFQAWELTSVLLQKIHNANCVSKEALIRSANECNPLMIAIDGPAARGGDSVEVTGAFNRAMCEALSKQVQ